METRKKQFTIEQKVDIVKEAEQFGFTETAHKHGISARAIYRWKDKLVTGGSKALKYGSKIDPELKELRIENERLKKLVAKQALYLEFKDELLKKVNQRQSKNNK
jgi:transposase-like protein